MAVRDGLRLAGARAEITGLRAVLPAPWHGSGSARGGQQAATRSPAEEPHDVPAFGQPHAPDEQAASPRMDAHRPPQGPSWRTHSQTWSSLSLPIVHRKRRLCPDRGWRWKAQTLRSSETSRWCALLRTAGIIPAIPGLLSFRMSRCRPRARTQSTGRKPEWGQATPRPSAG